jgi:hypothetical protein
MKYSFELPALSYGRVFVLFSGTKLPEPALLFTAADFLATDIMAQNQLSKGMYFNVATFVHIPTDKVEFTDAANLLHMYILDAKGNSSVIKLRDAQSAIVHGYLSDNLLYAKIVCKHNVSLIELSAYNTSHPGEKATEPETNGSIKVVKGKESGTYRVVIPKKKTKTLVLQDPHKRQPRVRYTIQLTLTPDVPASWVTVAEGCSFYKLIFSASFVTPGKKNHVRVYGVNSAGKGQPNAPFPFTPEIE